MKHLEHNLGKEIADKYKEIYQDYYFGFDVHEDHVTLPHFEGTMDDVVVRCEDILYALNALKNPPCTLETTSEK